MSILNSKISELKCSLDSYLLSQSFTSFSYGLVRYASLKDGNKFQTVNYDEKEERVTFDDRYDSSFYFKCNRKSFEKIKSSGKTQNYIISAEVELFVMAKSSKIEDIIISQLIKNGQIEITNINSDSDSISKKEIGTHGFELTQSLLSISFNIKYRSNECEVDGCK